MDKKTDCLVGAYYEHHHITGNRLRQSFEENVRGPMFASWIGFNKIVLDLGGRDGVLTKHYIESNQVTIGDIDRAALAYAKQHYDLKTAEINLNECIPFEDNSVDAVVMAEVLEHLPYPRVTLGEVKRILKSGGVFVGSVPLAYHLIDRWRVLRGKKVLISDVDPTHLQFFKYDEVLSLLSEFFRVKEVRVLKGGKKAESFPQLFARDIAFCCVKKQPTLDDRV